MLYFYVFKLDAVRKKVAEMSGRNVGDVRVVACPYRICPLGAHIDHQVCVLRNHFIFGGA